MSQKDISPKKMVKMSNYIRFYGPTKEELKTEFKLKDTSLRHYLTEIKKEYGLLREMRYKIE